MSDDYELICFDVVSDPSTKNAWIMNPGEEIKQEYLQETQTTPKNVLSEKLSNFGDWLNI